MIYFLSKSKTTILTKKISTNSHTHPVPETAQAALEDIDVLFESYPTWLFGPGSKKKLAEIIASRQTIDAGEKQIVFAENKASAERIETIATNEM